MSYILNEAIEVHDTLNPKLWNSDNTLKPEVYEKLTDIYEEFIRFIDLPLNIVDVEIVGSNASYNYNDTSDIDFHIIVNSEVTYMDATLLQAFYNSKKNSFNKDYDLTINDIPIELYIEDIKSGNATNGRYSILKNDWVKFPEPIKYDIPDISSELIRCEERCTELLESEDAQGILDFINELYMMRKLGLADEGEASVGNLVFKELRSMGMLDDLKDKYYSIKSSELSL